MTVHVVFVVPFFMTATLRFVSGAAALPGVRLSVISQEPAEKLPPALRTRLTGHWRIDDCFAAAQLVQATQALAARHGAVQRMIASLEQLQVPMAQARAQLGLPGLTLSAAMNFRDKNRMKDVLNQAALPCARHALIGSADDARAAAATLGFPLVAKPPAGAGAISTFRLNDAQQLSEYLCAYAPRAAEPVLFEEFLQGEEYSFDSVMLNGRVVWSSISSYRPSPLTVLENPWIQWCVLLPRVIDTASFAPIRRDGERALGVLGMRDGMTHMEWFRRPQGAVAISEVAARPPGAQFTSLLSWASNCDFYQAWPRLMIFDEFDPPAREFAAGAAYLRGMGTGRVRAVRGSDTIRREFAELIVESNWPEVGSLQNSGYEGAGYVIFRHPDTRRVEQALQRTVDVVRVELG